MSYRDLDVWNESVDLAVSTFKLAVTLPARERRDIADQMRSSAVSVPSNVAESTGRSGAADQFQFAVRARASLAELDTQVEICRRLNWLSAAADEDLQRRIRTVRQLLSGLIRYYNSRRSRMLDGSGDPKGRVSKGKP